MHGNGYYVDLNGNKYLGMFKYNKYHGKG